jgi:hypothetical protein
VEVLGFVLIIITGSWLLAARAGRRGQDPAQSVCILIALAMLGAMAFGALAFVVNCGLWGFDPPPPWERHLLPAGFLLGGLSGVAGAFFFAHRTDPNRVRERREAEADYDEPEHPGPADGPAPRP